MLSKYIFNIKIFIFKGGWSPHLIPLSIPPPSPPPKKKQSINQSMLMLYGISVVVFCIMYCTVYSPGPTVYTIQNMGEGASRGLGAPSPGEKNKYNGSPSHEHCCQDTRRLFCHFLDKKFNNLMNKSSIDFGVKSF